MNARVSNHHVSTILPAKWSHDQVCTTGPGFPVFSPDSRHVAYPAKHGSNQLVVVDGKESQEYEAVWPLVFDGPKRVRFVATRHDESFNKELLRVEIEIVEEKP